MVYNAREESTAYSCPGIGVGVVDGVGVGVAVAVGDPDGVPVKRNFVHVTDLANAILLALDNPRARQQTFNICMDEPVDYGQVGAYLNSTRGLPTVGIKTPYRSTWLDNTKAKFVLDWRPFYDLPNMIDAAFAYQRSPDNPRVVLHPG